MSAERWKAVRGFELYEVSTLGRVRSHCARQVRLRKLVPDKRGGYLNVGLRRDGKTFMRKVHHLVLEAFVGPRPRGTECRHGDRDVTNNRLSNLSWGTHVQNVADQIRHGTDSRGEKNGNASLTQEQAEVIRERRKNGERGGALAREYSVSQATISRVVHRRRYAQAS